MANMGTRWWETSILQAPAVLVNKGTRHCRQATYCNPAVSANKGARHRGQATYCFSASHSSLSQQGLKTLWASYIIQQHAPAVLVNKGARHCGRASLMMAVVQMGIDGTVHNHARIASTGVFFCRESNSTWRQP
jgi:hypothetical protein